VRGFRAPLLLSLAGAALMPISLFLDWYEVDEGATGDNAKIALKGWDSFESTDTVLVLAAIAVLALVLWSPPYVARAVMIVGALATGFIVVQLVDSPVILGFVDRSDVSLKIGAYLGLLGAVLVVVGGAISSAASAPRTAPDPADGESPPA
jgi:hypothetical protein